MPNNELAFMPNNELAKLLTDTLRSGLPTLFNPWRDRCDDCEPCNGPDAKLARLASRFTATRSLFFAVKRRDFRAVDTAGLRLLANIFCGTEDSPHSCHESQAHRQKTSV